MIQNNHQIPKESDDATQSWDEFEDYNQSETLQYTLNEPWEDVTFHQICTPTKSEYEMGWSTGHATQSWDEQGASDDSNWELKPTSEVIYIKTSKVETKDPMTKWFEKNFKRGKCPHMNFYSPLTLCNSCDLEALLAKEKQNARNQQEQPAQWPESPELDSTIKSNEWSYQWSDESEDEINFDNEPKPTFKDPPYKEKPAGLDKTPWCHHCM